MESLLKTSVINLNLVHLFFFSEMSMGVMADKKCIRDYRILISYYEDMKRIINSNVHIEEALLVLSREELSSIFPVLEEVIVDNSRYENEVFLDEIETIDVEDQNDSDTESVPDSFTFLDFCDSLNDSVNDHNKSSIEPQKLKKTNVKPEHVNMNPFSRDNKQGKRLHNHNKVPFRTQPDHLNLSKTASEASSGTRGFPAQRNHNRPKKTNLRENCSTFLDNPYDKFDYVTLDDALFIDRTRQNKQESGFRGRSRGRGRGQVYIRQTRRKGNHHNANFNKQFDIKMKSQENKPVEEDKLPPKNLFQSMKDIFD